MLIFGKSESFGLSVHHIAYQQNVKRELKAEITQKKSIENKHLFPQEINKAEAWKTEAPTEAGKLKPEKQKCENWSGKSETRKTEAWNLETWNLESDNRNLEKRSVKIRTK